MLKFMRMAAQGKVAKGLFVILIGGFAVWGIGPVFSNIGKVSHAAKAGDVTISIQDADRAYQMQLRALQQQYGFAIPEALQQQLGLKRTTLQSMAMQALYDQESRKLGLRMSHELVRQTLSAQPAFRNEKGQFDPARFNQVLRSAGYSEADYVRTMTGDIIRTLASGGVGASAGVPTSIASRVYAYEHEQRVVESLLVKNADITNVPTPTEAELTKFHQDNSQRFMAPEYRAITYLNIELAKIAEGITISEEDARAEYDKAPADYADPEKRDLLQITTQDEALAKKIADEVASGKSLEEAAKANNQIVHPAPGLTRGNIPPQLADQIFSLAEGKTTGAVRSQIGWHVITVTKITAGHQPEFAQVRDRILTDMKNAQAQEKLQTLVSQIEDAVAGGAKLSEAATTAGQTAISLDNISIFAFRPDDSEVKDIPNSEQLLKAAFDTQTGETSPAQQTPQGVFFVAVNGITPSALKPFARVGAEVVKAWTEAKRAELAEAKANGMLAKLNTGGTVAGLTKSDPLNRDGSNHGTLPENLLSRIFASKVGDVFTSKSADGTWLIRLAAIKPAALEGADLSQVKTALRQSLGLELIEQHGLELRKIYGVTLNEKWLAAATTAGE